MAKAIQDMGYFHSGVAEWSTVGARRLVFIVAAWSCRPPPPGGATPMGPSRGIIPWGSSGLRYYLMRGTPYAAQYAHMYECWRLRKDRRFAKCLYKTSQHGVDGGTRLTVIRTHDLAGHGPGVGPVGRASGGGLAKGETHRV